MAWMQFAPDYKELIESEDWDSRYLREKGLVPNLLDLVGDVSEKAVLDAGTGTGWLFKRLQPNSAFACDLIQPEKIPDHVSFDIQDIHNLTYSAKKFDLVVSSLVLIYCQDLRQVCTELNRVTKPGGMFVASIMNPYFYRTGEALDNGMFRVSKDLSKHFTIDLKIAEEVGPFTYYYRSLPEYINTLIETDWVLDEVRDWYVDMEDYEHSTNGSKSKLRRTGNVPMYTFFRCHKK